MNGLNCYDAYNEPRKLDRVFGLGKFSDEGHADEAFCLGTAAAISPIGTITWKGHAHTFGNGGIGALTQKLFNSIDGIQTGSIPDPFGWTLIVE